MAYFRFRIITNFHCNQACSFCFQPVKTEEILPLDTLQNTLDKCPRMSRSTLMGGESTLLPNLPDYIAMMKAKTDVVCLVTNGTLLRQKNLIEYRDAGLEEIAISISSIEQYNKMKLQISLANQIITNCRVNIPKSPESIGQKLYDMVETILDDGVGVVVCEDLMGRYGIYEFEEKMGAKLVRTDGHNFLTYEYKGNEFGLFAHFGGYDKTDIIITPRGNFYSWKQYCAAIGNKDLS